MARSKDVFRRAEAVLPGGTTRVTVRRDPTPIYMAQGSGAWLTDLDGNRYLDLSLGVSGALSGKGSLGHLTRPILAEADLVFLIGTRTNQNGTDSWQWLLTPETTVVADASSSSMWTASCLTSLAPEAGQEEVQALPERTQPSNASTTTITSNSDSASTTSSPHIATPNDSRP